MTNQRQEQGQPQSPAPCALEEALSGAGIGAFDAAGVMRGGWESLLAAPMGGGSLDAPGGVPAAGGVELGAAGGEDGDENREMAMAMAGREVRWGAVQICPVRYGPVRSGPVRYGTVRYGTMPGVLCHGCCLVFF